MKIQKNKRLILVRGISGSGKSTKAKALINQAKIDRPGLRTCHAEADEFLYIEKEYVWSRERVKKAHQKCKEKTTKAMRSGADLIVVSNTFSKEWELIPYFFFAEEFGYDTEVITALGDYGNTHNIPNDKIEAQKSRFDDNIDYEELRAKVKWRFENEENPRAKKRRAKFGNKNQ